MPLINVKLIEGVFSPEQKEAIAHALTDAMVSVEGENMRPVCTVRSDGGMMNGFRNANVFVFANLHLWEWWNQPPTEPLPQVDQIQGIADFHCRSSGFFSIGAIDGGSVFRGKDLRYTTFVIPSHGAVVFEVVLSINYNCAHGQVDVNFASGDREVICPAVLV